ncbi:MAG: hypothetical protein NW237_14535 [Cyanobacteriota bacterium]|nr:hypothetical protein [Cyanobacteriota bacterium]
MKAYEFLGYLGEDGNLKLPSEALRILPKHSQIRVLILLDDTQSYPLPTRPSLNDEDPPTLPYDGI